MDEFTRSCDTLTASIPHFQDRFVEMAKDTEDMVGKTIFWVTWLVGELFSISYLFRRSK